MSKNELLGAFITINVIVAILSVIIIAIVDNWINMMIGVSISMVIINLVILSKLTKMKK